MVTVTPKLKRQIKKFLLEKDPGFKHIDFATVDDDYYAFVANTLLFNSWLLKDALKMLWHNILVAWGIRK